MTRLISEVLLRQMQSASLWQILNGKRWVKSTSPLIFVFFLFSKLEEKLCFPLCMGCFRGTFKISKKWLVKSSTEARPHCLTTPNTVFVLLSLFSFLTLAPLPSMHFNPRLLLEVMLLQETWHTVIKKARIARCFLVENPASFAPLATAQIAVPRHPL